MYNISNLSNNFQDRGISFIPSTYIAPLQDTLHRGVQPISGDKEQFSAETESAFNTAHMSHSHVTCWEGTHCL